MGEVKLAVPFDDGGQSNEQTQRRNTKLAAVPDGGLRAAEALLGQIPEEFVACREGRHSYPRVRLQDMRFKRGPQGFDIFVRDCTECGQAYQEEWWVIDEDRHGNVLRMKLHRKITKYRRPLEGGRSPYLLPAGSGYHSPNEIRETRVAAFWRSVGGVRRYGKRSEGGTG